jgi:hypothetical protein
MKGLTKKDEEVIRDAYRFILEAHGIQAHNLAMRGPETLQDLISGLLVFIIRENKGRFSEGNISDLTHKTISELWNEYKSEKVDAMIIKIKSKGGLSNQTILWTEETIVDALLNIPEMKFFRLITRKGERRKRRKNKRFVKIAKATITDHHLAKDMLDYGIRNGMNESQVIVSALRLLLREDKYVRR